MENIKSALAEQAQIILNDINKDNKAAHARVRKATLAIQKLGKEYRRLSIEEDKAK